MKRSEKDFDEWAAGGAVLHASPPMPDQIDEGAAVLRRLHGERWEGTGGGTFRSPRFLAFHADAMRGDAGGGRVAAGLAGGARRAGGRDVQRGTRRQRRAFYQCGRKLDVPKNLRPGGVLLYREMRRALEEGEREFDFLGGEATYKRQLALSERPLATLRIVRPGWREQARRLAEWGKTLLRRLRPGRAKAADASGPK